MQLFPVFRRTQIVPVAEIRLIGYPDCRYVTVVIRAPTDAPNVRLCVIRRYEARPDRADVILQRRDREIDVWVAVLWSDICRVPVGYKAQVLDLCPAVNACGLSSLARAVIERWIKVLGIEDRLVVTAPERKRQ